MSTSWTDKVNALKAAGMSFTAIAKAIHLAPSTVCDLARGKYKQPRADAAVRLAKLYSEHIRRQRKAAETVSPTANHKTS